jgi:hypothetical protein
MTNNKTENTTVLEDEYIEILGAREHNLKNIDVKIPRNKLVKPLLIMSGLAVIAGEGVIQLVPPSVEYS